MTTEERLEKMEGQLARVRWFNRCLIACIALSLLVGLPFLVAGYGVKEIRANAFILEDENGNERADLAVHEDGPKLGLLDENGDYPSCVRTSWKPARRAKSERGTLQKKLA